MTESQQELREALATALRAGQMMLEYGASTARVEDTVRRIGLALGAAQVEVFATPTGVFATLIRGELHTTRVLRIARSNLDLSKIEATLAISRRIAAGDLSAHEALAALNNADGAPRPYNLLLTVSASGICSGASAGLFGGGSLEIGATTIAAAIAYLCLALLGRLQFSRLMATGLAAAIATGLAFAIAVALHAPAPTIAMQAAILMLTPGVLIVSAIADLFGGDTLSGITRAAMALLAVAAIAAGVWAILAINGVAMVLPQPSPPSWPIALGQAIATTAGFAMLFAVPVRRLFACVLAGVVAYAANRIAIQVGSPLAIAMFVGGAAVGLFAELLARLLRAPSSIFTIPGIITLVPGGLAFRTMLSFAQNDVSSGAANLVLTLLLAGGLAAGLGVVTAVTGVRLGRVE